MLMMARSLNLTNYHADNTSKQRAFTVLERLAHVEDAETDVFAVDNTNSIENSFSIVKRRLLVRI